MVLPFVFVMHHWGRRIGVADECGPVVTMRFGPIGPIVRTRIMMF